jgi:hypothetical protein
VKLSTNNTLVSSLSLTNSALSTTETSLSRKRKAEPLESTVITQSPIQESSKKSALTTASTTVSLSDNDERKYNIENIQPIPSESIRLGIDLHCHVPAPKRPRIDPFNSIFARLENQNTSDDDFNVGIKTIKV